MQIHWCQEHNSPLLVERDLYGQTLQLCQLAAWDETETGDCRFDAMRLVSTDAIVVERGVGEHEGEWPEWALRTVEYEANDLGGEGLRILNGLARGHFSEV